MSGDAKQLIQRESLPRRARHLPTIAPGHRSHQRSPLRTLRQGSALIALKPSPDRSHDLSSNPSTYDQLVISAIWGDPIKLRLAIYPRCRTCLIGMGQCQTRPSVRTLFSRPQPASPVAEQWFWIALGIATSNPANRQLLATEPLQNETFSRSGPLNPTQPTHQAVIYTDSLKPGDRSSSPAPRLPGVAKMASGVRSLRTGISPTSNILATILATDGATALFHHPVRLK